jgi:hypothetical protein
MNYILSLIVSLLQNATCLAYKWKSEIIEDGLSYKVLIAIFVLSLFDVDHIILFPTNLRINTEFCYAVFTAVTLCSVYVLKLTYFSSWLHFKETETNLRTMACTKINLNQFTKSHPLSVDCQNLITILFKRKICSQNNRQ